MGTIAQRATLVLTPNNGAWSEAKNRVIHAIYPHGIPVSELRVATR